MVLQMMLLQGQGCGEDVESVENLIRRLEETEREVRVIQERGEVSVRLKIARVFVAISWLTNMVCKC